MSSTVQSAESELGPIPRTHLVVALGALLTVMAWATTVTGLSFFTNPILTEFGWDIGIFTIYFTIYSLASAFTMPLAAQLMPRLGARGLLIVGGIVAAAGLVIFGSASSLWMFYVGGLVAGLGVGLSVQYVPVVLVNRWFVARRSLVLGIVLGGSGVGGALLAVILPGALGALGWRGGLYVLAGIMVLFTAVPTLLFIKERPEDIGAEAYGAHLGAQKKDTSDEPGLTRAQATGTPWFYVLFASLVLMGMTHGMNQHVVNYLALRPWGIDVPERFVSQAILVATIGLVLYKPLLGWLVDRIGLVWTLVSTLSIAAVATFVSAYATVGWIYLVCVALFSLGFANGTVSPPLIGQRAFGEKDFSVLWGILGSAYPVGAAFGVPIWGWVRDQFGSYGWGFISVPVTTALFLTGFLLSMRGARRLWVPQAQD